MCDPQLRMMLELVHAAVEDAGYAPRGSVATSPCSPLRARAATPP
jgi:acyl transferase domain-containing protein